MAQDSELAGGGVILVLTSSVPVPVETEPAAAETIDVELRAHAGTTRGGRTASRMPPAWLSRRVRQRRSGDRTTRPPKRGTVGGLDPRPRWLRLRARTGGWGTALASAILKRFGRSCTARSTPERWPPTDRSGSTAGRGT